MKITLNFLFLFTLFLALTYNCNAETITGRMLAESASTQIGVTKSYDPTYRKLGYPNGDVPISTGVCSDVIIRAYRKFGIDLQRNVHEDMSQSFRVYPHNWGLKSPDSNIDHRRVPNLMRYFSRFGKVLPLSRDANDYNTGDIVAWDLGHGITHIGIIVEKSGKPEIIHNIGEGVRQEDRLFEWKIIGHYSFSPR
jgi:uncharacterized protein YijF (DUF1287 family)